MFAYFTKTKKPPALTRDEEDFLKKLEDRLRALEQSNEDSIATAATNESRPVSVQFPEQKLSNSGSVRRYDSMFGNPKAAEATKSLSLLLDNNKLWAAEKVANEPEFFRRLGGSQAPNYMWIGCSDSRVPANQIVSMPPGEIFVHRNVANLVYATDNNVMSVLQYAIENLKVKHVIVCGHACCGGVRAAFGPSLPYPLEGWLSSIRGLKAQHEKELAALATEEEKWQYLCEANVRAQVATLATLPVVQNAWANRQQLSIHGLFYSMENGILRDMEVSQPKPVEDYFDLKQAIERAKSPTIKQILVEGSGVQPENL